MEKSADYIFMGAIILGSIYVLQLLPSFVLAVLIVVTYVYQLTKK